MIYLDNAATTFPKPPAVLKSVSDAITIYGGNPGRSGHPLSMKTSEKIFTVRTNLADFFGVNTEQVVFTSNCTHALNLAIKGVMAGGGHIVLSCLDHNSVLRPIHALSQQNKIEYDIANVYEDDMDRTIESFASLLKTNTKAIVCTHASNVTGMVLPIRKLGELCHQHGILLIVDGAQSVGVLPINLKQMNIDILCTAGHKGLYGSTGTGLLILNTSYLLNTLMEGGTGSLSIEWDQPIFLPDRYESGTINTTGILSVGAGLSHLQKIGLERVYAHEFSLCQTIYHGLKTMPAVTTYIQSYEKDRFVPIVLFNLKNKTSIETVALFNQRGYCLRGGLHCSPLAHTWLKTLDSGAVRVSPSIFTTTKEIQRFLHDLVQIIKLS